MVLDYFKYLIFSSCLLILLSKLVKMESLVLKEIICPQLKAPKFYIKKSLGVSNSTTAVKALTWFIVYSAVNLNSIQQRHSNV